ncbi:MAG: MerR family transcriptional regulator [Clostridia bacterium]|nr:MerR family transcriptional regulator [Clostridia bacterium]
MMTVSKVSNLTGVSIRTLQYYDKIGLLTPSGRTGAGYRLYCEGDLERLQQIMLFRELEFSLKEIKSIIKSPEFDRKQALEQQIKLLTLKREHLDNLITFARGLNQTGGNNMDFSAFDTEKLERYAQEAKEKWQHTDAYKEFEEKTGGRSPQAAGAIAAGLMSVFEDFGKIKDTSPESDEAQALVKRLQNYITENYYTCTPEILKGLGAMYGAGGKFTENIDKAGGQGTAKFTEQAIGVYCR